MSAPRIYRFEDGTLLEDVTLDLAAMRLSRGTQDLPLEPKSYRLLALLIDHRDRVLTKEEIFRTLWAETAVTDNALTRSIAQIRKVLADDPRQPRFIETVPTVGYRFIGTLVPDAPAADPALTPPPSPPASPAPARPRPSRRLVLWAGLAAALLVAAGLAAWLRPHPLAPIDTVSDPIPLTTYTGDQDAPSLSPDGTQVAFQWDGDDHQNLDIYAKALAPDAAPLRLTTDPAADRWPAWSPDGSTIAFQRTLAGSSRVELRTIPALGGPERRIASFDVNLVGSAPVWSPDSRWLIVCAWLKDRVALVRVSAETGEMTQLTDPGSDLDDDSPAISADGRTLLFIRRPDFYYWGDLYRVALEDGLRPADTPKRLPTGGLLLDRVLWQPDGDQILVHTADGVSRMPSSGSDHPAPVPFLGADVGSFDLSRKGHRLAFTNIRGDANLWRLDLTRPRLSPQPLIASTFRDVSPRYSPDGRTIAFQSNRTQPNRSIGRSQIWLADSEGQHVRELTAVKSRTSGSPRWTPDGRTIAFDSNVSGRYQVYAIPADGGPIAQLTPDTIGNFGSAWSPDGQALFYASKHGPRGDIWKISPAGSAPVQVTHNGGEFPLVSPDGKTLFFVKFPLGGQMGGSIWKMPLPDGPEVQLTDSVFRGNFAVRQHGLYFMTAAAANGTSTLKFLSFATGQTRIIAAMGHPEYGLDVSPDEHFLLYAQLDNVGRDLMLIQNFH